MEPGCGQQMESQLDRNVYPCQVLNLSTSLHLGSLDSDSVLLFACLDRTLLLTHFRYAINMRTRRARAIKTIASLNLLQTQQRQLLSHFTRKDLTRLLC